MSEPGWHPDPTGRFTQRWFDGDAWTDSVQGPDGEPGQDPVNPEPPAVAAAPVSVSSSPPAMSGTGPAWIGPAIAGVGVLSILLGLFALDWVSAGGSSSDWADLRKGFEGASGEGIDTVVVAYMQWLGFVALAAAVAGAGAAALSKPGTSSRTILHVVGATAAGIAAVLHGITVARLFRGEFVDPEFGAWLPTVGYLIMIAALVAGAWRDPRPA